MQAVRLKLAGGKPKVVPPDELSVSDREDRSVPAGCTHKGMYRFRVGYRDKSQT